MGKAYVDYHIKNYTEPIELKEIEQIEGWVLKFDTLNIFMTDGQAKELLQILKEKLEGEGTNE